MTCLLSPSGRGLLLLLLLGAAPVAGQPSAAVAAEAPIELPKFEVSDSRVLPPQQKWRYAAIPGFEVLSSISARETTRFVRDFLLLQTVIAEIMPAFRPSDVAVPSSLILTGRGRDFDRFIPVDRADDRFRTTGLFFDDPERSAIVVDFALSELTLEDNTTEEADPYRDFYKSYFRNLVRRQAGGIPPAWFEEGLVQIFASIEFNRKWITFAQIGDGFGGPKTGDFNRILNERALMAFPELFAETPQRTTFWSAQCYGFVHMCLYGRGQKYQKGFIKFLSRIGSEAPSEAIFKECLGLSFKDMALELRGYIGFTDYKAMQYTAKKGKELPEPPAVTLRDATDAESGRIVGEVLRLGAHGAEAHLALIAPYIRGERDPQLLAALGLDERIAGNGDRARKFLEAAAKANAERPRVYLELGKIRYETATTAPGGADGKLSAAQVAHALEPLMVARKQKPPMAQVYALIAEIWRQSEKAPTKAEFDVVVEGAQTFPRSAGLILQAAMLAATHAFTKEAYYLAAHGVKIARTAGERERFTTLAAAFERDAAPPKPAEKSEAKKAESYLPKLP